MVHWPGDDNEDTSVAQNVASVVTHECPRTGAQIADWDFEDHVKQFSTKVAENLYLGNQSNASDINQLNHSKDTITHILNIQQNGKTPFGDSGKFTYKVVPLENLPAERLIDHLAETNEFIANAVKGGGKVLVHCDTGRSRSAAVVIAYLMFSQKKKYKAALSIVNKGRKAMFQSNVAPNHGFIRQLRQYEKQLHN